MANNIGTQARKSLEKLETLVIAMHSLAGVAANLQDGGLMDFSNIHNYVSCELDNEFQAFRKNFIEQVLPLVDDIKTFRVA